jgi:hypothetical protein
MVVKKSMACKKSMVVAKQWSRRQHWLNGNELRFRRKAQKLAKRQGDQKCGQTNISQN